MEWVLLVVSASNPCSIPNPKPCRASIGRVLAFFFSGFCIGFRALFFGWGSGHADFQENVKSLCSVDSSTHLAVHGKQGTLHTLGAGLP